jgi:hypothetical protein
MCKCVHGDSGRVDRWVWFVCTRYSREVVRDNIFSDVCTGPGQLAFTGRCLSPRRQSLKSDGTAICGLGELTSTSYSFTRADSAQG